MSEWTYEFWSTWYQPLLGALHVLGLALFGGALFAEAPTLRRIGVVWMVLTGVTLFLLSPERLLASAAFRLKMALLVGLLFLRGPRWLVLTLWVAVIFASRGIAYF